MIQNISCGIYLFYAELEQKVLYIAESLNNPMAAQSLLDAVEEAILKRLPVAEAFESYKSVRERKYPYYRIYVKNFVIYNKQDGDHIV